MTALSVIVSTIMHMPRTLLPVLLSLHLSPTLAGNSEFSGSVDAELRGFPDDPQFADQFDGLQPSLALQPEYYYSSNDESYQFNVTLFARLDGQDSRRTHFDIREAYGLWLQDDWELLLGIERVFWGVTESRHLVDIINQTDFVENIDTEDKLGQPMINLSSQQDWGWISLYVMPVFRERTFPGKQGRLRLPLVTDGDPTYDGNASRTHPDTALRYSEVFGDWDVGIYAFHGVGREPRFVVSNNGSRLVPTYDLINQTGVDLQYTFDAWLWKFEGLVREGQADTFVATVAGFEYTLYQLFSSNIDLGLLSEYLYDGRDKNPQQAPVTTSEDDIFFGARLAFNDVQDTELLAGTIVDRKDRSTSWFIEAGRRIDDHWDAEIEVRLFTNTDDDLVLQSFRDDSFAQFRISYNY